MSDFGAIAAVTEILRSELATAAGLDGATVTIDSLDKLGSADANPALNIYLYQILPNANWRNSDIPWRGKPGDTGDGGRGRAPLALDLHYLLTATAQKQTDAHRHLGAGMRMLHDNPILQPKGTVAPFERVRISLLPLSLDDIEKLWMGVPTSRMLSVAYEASVILIESEIPTVSPLPVLSRGRGRPDSIEVDAELPLSIDRIEIGDQPFDRWLRAGSRSSRPAAQTDDKIFICADGLSGPETKTAIIASLLHQPAEIVTAELTTVERGRLVVDLSKLDFAGKRFPAGPCSIRLKVKGSVDGADYSTNAILFSLAPKITSILPADPLRMPKDLTVAFNPPLVDHQEPVLIVSTRQFTPQSGLSTSQRVFHLDQLSPGKYPIRLRVDGVDSLSIDLSKAVAENSRPAFFNTIEVS
jgi:hypothetical protein